MNMQSVLFEVAKERGRQDTKWGGPVHDDKHKTKEFAEFIDLRTDRIRVFLHLNPDADGTKEPASHGETPRSLLIEIAALAVAAVESIDRKLPNERLDRRPQGQCRNSECGWSGAIADAIQKDGAHFCPYNGFDVVTPNTSYTTPPVV